MKKLLALILVLCMSLAVLVACAGDGTDDTTTPAGGDVTTPSGDPTSPGETTVNTTNQTVGSFGGAEINFLAWQEGYVEFEFNPTDTFSTSINEAIRDRNEATENRLDCKIKVTFTKGNYDNQQAFLTKAQSFANGDEGEFMDVYGSYSMTTALLSTKGLCANLMGLQSETGLNFKNPWWPDTMVKEAMFQDRLYVCTGDISTNLLWMMETVYFNKDLMEDLNHDPLEPYQLVDEGKWTIDKFYEYVTDVYADTDADGKKSVGDTYGHVTNTWNGFYDDFYVGAGFKTVVKDASGNLTIADAWGGEVEDKFADTLAEFRLGKDHLNNDAQNEIFCAGRALFNNGRAAFAKTARETAECEYGILPNPKLNEAQENYSTCIGFPHTLYAIASSSAQQQTAAVVMESLAAEGYNKVTPALFYDALQLRYSPEVEDAMSFDVLKTTLCFDIGRIYTTSINNISWSVFRDNIAKGSMHYSIQCTSKKEQFNILLTKLQEDLLASPQ